MGEETSARAVPGLAKVPKVALVFWVVKVLTTGMGESASDYLASVNLALAAGVGLIGFAAAMWLQLRTDRYVAAVYWFAVAMVAVFGTMVADAVHVVLGVPYSATTTFYAVALGVVLTLWWRSEGTLSIHSIVTPRREIYYWLTVLVTFALGTAAGDLTAVSLHLGYFSSGVLFAAAIAVPALAWWRLRLNAVVAFWVAYVLTRPLGASFADWFGKPHHRAGGLGWGDDVVTGGLAVAIVVAVAYLARTRCDIQSPAAALGAGPLRPPASHRA